MSNRRLGMAVATVLTLGMVGSAFAQVPPAPAPQPVAPPPVAAPPPAEPAPASGSGSMMAADRDIPVGDAAAFASDHDAVVGHIGLEAVFIPIFPGPGAPPIGGAPNGLNAAGVRMWMNRNMAFNADLAFVLGGGTDTMPPSTGMTTTRDTFFGFGPAGGLTFLMGNWKHVAVGASPQLAIVYYTPGGDMTESTIAVNLRAQMEAELHLGFIGAPSLSLSLATGLAFNYRSTTDTASRWQIGMLGQQGFWSAITNFALRFYM